MSISILSKLDEYYKKFPLRTREAIVEIMLQDGVITPEIAEKINSGVSIFMLDKEETTNNHSYTEVFGGYFSKKEVSEIVKTHPNTHLLSIDKNGEIIPEQFTIEGLKAKFDNNKYDITEEIDEYKNRTISVIDKDNKKVIHKITIDSPWLDSTTITVSEYDKNEECTNSVLLHENNGKYKIGRVDNYDYQKGEGKQIFYDDSKIKKIYEWKDLGNDIWDITKTILYSNNKPYKEMTGDETIINYIVNDLITDYNEEVKRGKYEMSMAFNFQQSIKCITKKNVYEILYDYLNQTGRDLIDDIKLLKEKNNSYYTYYTYYTYDKILEDIDKKMMYDGGISNDSWLNNHSEKYISEILKRDLEDCNINKFRNDLKYAGINLNEDEKKNTVELFGNPMVSEVLIQFRTEFNEHNSNNKTSPNHGLLYAIATNKDIKVDDRADLLLDIISQLGYLYDDELQNEIKEFAKDKEFLNLILEYCTKDKCCEDIKADIILNKNNPEKLLVDLKRLKARNIPRESGTEVSKPNGKIDIDFEQGMTGDCWLLAGIISLCHNGIAKSKLESLLDVNPTTGDVTVTLKGVNKKYKITYNEICEAKHLSSGEGDMRAIEIALDKYVRELAYRKETDSAREYDINGNTTYYLYQVLFGNGKDLGKYSSSMNNEINNPNKAFCIGGNILESDYRNTINVVINSEGEKEDFILGHAYAVVKADNEYVYLVNPWESKEILKIRHEDLEKLNVNIGVCEF